MKKLLSILLTVALLMGLAGVSSIADGEPAFQVSSAEAEPGEEVSLTVSLVNSPCVAAIELAVDYDASVLEWTGVQQGEYGGTYDLAVGQLLTWFAADPRSGETKDGVFCTLTFKVLEGASGQTAVTITYDEDSVYNPDEDNVFFNVLSGGVDVKGAPSVPTHVMTAIEAADADCTTDGNSAYYYCADCQKYFADAEGTTEIEEGSWIIPATGHTAGEAVVENEVAAGCETAGSYDEVVYCTKCGEELSRETKTIDPTGHSWGEWTVTKEATEGAEGEETRVCANDHTHTETRPIPALIHTHVLMKVDASDASCEEDGNSEYYSCSGCDLFFADAEGTTEIAEGSWIIPATGHTAGEVVVENEVAAGCETAGSYDEVVYCTECGKEIFRESKTIDPIGHSWGEWTLTKEATEDAEGEETRVCANDSSHTETRVIPMLVDTHELVKVDAIDASCEENGNIEHYICNKCGKIFSDAEGTNEITEADTVVEALGHDWDEGVVTKEATTEEEGEITYTCRRCGETRTETLEKLTDPDTPSDPGENPGTPSDPETPGNTPGEGEDVPQSPSTGYQANRVALVAVFALCAVGIIVAIEKRVYVKIKR